MKKKANIGFTVLIALIVVCCGAAVLSIAGNSKYNAKIEYRRIGDRYIAESGVDLSVGLFLNYLSNKDLVLTYTKNEDDGKGEEKPLEEIVKVKKITVENKTLYLDRYETEKIAYSLSPNNVTNDNITFQSSNTSVATVDDEGNVYAKRKGNTIITLESEDGNASATVKVYVTDYDDNDDYDSTLRNVV